MEKFVLKIYSFHGDFFIGEVYSLTIKAVDGYMTVLKDHVPLISAVSIGELRFVDSTSKKHSCYSSGGILYVSQSITFFISNAIYYLKDINYARAQSIKQRIENELSETKNKQAAKKLQSDLINAGKLLGKTKHSQ